MSKDIVTAAVEKNRDAMRIKMVRMREDIQFFGINGSQIAATQTGIKLEWKPETMVVVVRHSSFPGEERWLLPAGISFVAFEVEK